MPFGGTARASDDPAFTTVSAEICLEHSVSNTASSLVRHTAGLWISHPLQHHTGKTLSGATHVHESSDWQENGRDEPDRFHGGRFVGAMQNRTSGRNERTVARDRTAEKDPASSHRDAQSGSHRLVFVPGDSTKGKEVYNTGDEKSGTVNDLIIEPRLGSDRLRRARDRHDPGDGRQVRRRSYSAFGWDQMDKHVLLNSTPDAIKAWPEFDKGMERAWPPRIRPCPARFPISTTRNGLRTRPIRPTRTRDEKISGRVTNIVRQPTPKGPEELVVTVTDPTGAPATSRSGPPGTAGNSVQIYRGTPVDMRIIRSTATDGRPSSPGACRSTPQHRPLRRQRARLLGRHQPHDRSPGQSQSATASDPSDEIVGKKVDCRGEQCGEIDDIIVECTTGRVAFVRSTPTQNTLGIGDTNRPPVAGRGGIRADRVPSTPTRRWL